jgi:hypothetical protein
MQLLGSFDAFDSCESFRTVRTVRTIPTTDSVVVETRTSTCRSPKEDLRQLNDNQLDAVVAAFATVGLGSVVWLLGMMSAVDRRSARSLIALASCPCAFVAVTITAVLRTPRMSVRA